MNVWRALYRRLDSVQRRRSFKIAASVISLICCAAYFGALIAKANDLQRQKSALVNALFGQSHSRNDELAVSFRDRGEVIVGDVVYGGEQFRRRSDLYFDQQGFFAAPVGLADELIADQKPAWALEFLVDDPNTATLIAIITTIWLLLIIWTEITLPFLLVLLGTGIPILICLDPVHWLWSQPKQQAILAIGGIGLLTFTYVLLTRVLLLGLSFPAQAVAVAHTVVKEASRLRISLVFIVLLLVLLPLLPLWLDPEDPLRFRVQTFISRSMDLTFYTAACMTLFLACASVAFEIRDRQIWQLMSKPLSRVSYLFGKWLGVIGVNLVLLLVSGVSIFVYVQYLRQLPVAPGVEGQLDRLAVTDEVLTARVGRYPAYEPLSDDAVRARVDERINNDPDLAAQGEISPAVRREIAKKVREEFSMAQRLIPPARAENPISELNTRSYLFEGLGAARDINASVTLRYKFHILRSDEHEQYPVAFVFNENINQRWVGNYTPNLTHSIALAPDLIREDGTILLSIVNTYVPTDDQYARAQGTINFDPDRLELLYKVGNFPDNFIRALMINWVKLAFLAMIGIAASTFLSFAVACLLSFTVFLGGVLAPFVTYSLDQFYPPPIEQMDWGNIGLVLQWLFQTIIRNVAIATVWLVGGFGDFRPAQALVEGRFIPWGLNGPIPWKWVGVFGALFKLGLVWCGLALGFGYAFFRKRELATYSGHG